MEGRALDTYGDRDNIKGKSSRLMKGGPGEPSLSEMEQDIMVYVPPMSSTYLLSVEQL